MRAVGLSASRLRKNNPIRYHPQAKLSVLIWALIPAAGRISHTPAADESGVYCILGVRTGNSGAHRVVAYDLPRPIGGEDKPRPGRLRQIAALAVVPEAQVNCPSSCIGRRLDVDPDERFAPFDRYLTRPLRKKAIDFLFEGDQNAYLAN